SGAGLMPRSSGRREQVLRYLREADGAASVEEIAAGLGVHVNTVRYHLQALSETGQVASSTESTERAGRPARRYRSVPQMDPDGPRHWRTLAEILAAGFSATGQPADRARAAGKRWASQQVAQRAEQP